MNKKKTIETKLKFLAIPSIPSVKVDHTAESKSYLYLTIGDYMNSFLCFAFCTHMHTEINTSLTHAVLKKKDENHK